MFIKKEDLKLLEEIELYLWDNNAPIDLYLKIHSLIYKLLKQNEKNNIKNYARIKAKRQLDKNYARKKKEKEQF